MEYRKLPKGEEQISFWVWEAVQWAQQEKRK